MAKAGTHSFMGRRFPVTLAAMRGGDRAGALPLKGFGLAVVLLAAGCSATPGGSGDELIRTMGLERPAPERFTLCYNNGCAERAEIRLRPTDWRLVRAIFEPTPTSAAEERGRVAVAVAVLEILSGEQAGTLHDAGGSMNFFTGTSQLDCIDETANTTTYLVMMRDDGLLRWHDITGPAARGFFLMGWPHLSAVIRDRATERSFVVDSWFFDNGVRATIVPVATWMGDWWEPGAPPPRVKLARRARARN